MKADMCTHWILALMIFMLSACSAQVPFAVTNIQAVSTVVIDPLPCVLQNIRTVNVTLSWSTPAGSEGDPLLNYKVMCPTATESSKQITVQPSDSPSVNIQVLGFYKHTCTITPYNRHGEGSQASFEFRPELPSYDSSLAVIGSDVNSLTLRWTAEYRAHYHLQFQDSNGVLIVLPLPDETPCLSIGSVTYKWEKLPAFTTDTVTVQLQSHYQTECSWPIHSYLQQGKVINKPSSVTNVRVTSTVIQEGDSGCDFSATRRSKVTLILNAPVGDTGVITPSYTYRIICPTAEVSSRNQTVRSLEVDVEVAGFDEHECTITASSLLTGDPFVFKFRAGLPKYDSLVTVSQGMNELVLSWTAALSAKYYLRMSKLDGSGTVETSPTDCQLKGLVTYTWTGLPAYFNQGVKVQLQSAYQTGSTWSRHNYLDTPETIYTLPGSPFHVEVSRIRSSDSFILSWNPPAYTGGNFTQQVVYKIQCERGNTTVSGTTSEIFWVFSLQMMGEYVCAIVTMNSAYESAPARVTFSTDAIPQQAVSHHSLQDYWDTRLYVVSGGLGSVVLLLLGFICYKYRKTNPGIQKQKDSGTGNEYEMPIRPTLPLQSITCPTKESVRDKDKYVNSAVNRTKKSDAQKFNSAAQTVDYTNTAAGNRTPRIVSKKQNKNSPAIFEEWKVCSGPRGQESSKLYYAMSSPEEKTSANVYEEVDISENKPVRKKFKMYENTDF